MAKNVPNELKFLAEILWAFKVAERADFRQNGLKMTKNSHLGNFEGP